MSVRWKLCGFFGIPEELMTELNTEDRNITFELYQVLHARHMNGPAVQISSKSLPDVSRDYLVQFPLSYLC